MPHFLTSEYDQAITWGERALSLAERLGGQDVTVHAMNNVGYSYAVLGQVERGLNMLKESLQRALALGLPYDAGRAQNNIASLLLGLGRYAEAQATLEAMQTYAARHHVTVFVILSLIMLTELNWQSGKWAAALVQAQTMRDSIDDVETLSLMKMIANAKLGWIYNDLGQPQTARQVLEKKLPIVRSSGQLQTSGYLGQLARAYALLGFESETRTIIDEFINLFDRTPYADFNSPMPLLFACQWLAVVPGRLADTQACLQRLERTDKQIGSPETAACLGEGRGSVALAEGDSHQAVEQCRQAVARWGEIDRPYDQARTLKYLGQSLKQLNDSAGARNALHQANGIVEMLSAQLEDEELKSSFLNSPLVQEIRAGLE